MGAPERMAWLVVLVLLGTACGAEPDDAALRLEGGLAPDTADGAVTASPTAAPEDEGREELPAGDDPIAEPPPPAGLVAYDPYRRVREPAPPMRALLALPGCAAGGGTLSTWAEEALAPFGSVSSPAVPVPPADVADTTPLFVPEGDQAACAYAAVADDVEMWELRDARGVVTARGVASERLADRFPHVYERQSELGGINFGGSTIGSGQHVTGVWRGDRMELEFSETEPRRKSLLIVEWPGGPPPEGGIRAQMRAEHRASALSTTLLDPPHYT